jgi:outer membrane protein insertion porin family
MFFLLFCFRSFSQTKRIEKKEFIGNKILQNEYLQNELSNIDSVSSLNSNMFKELIQKIYFKNGILGSVIDSISSFNTDRNTIIIKIYITEGKPLILEKILFSGNHRFNENDLSEHFSSILNHQFDSLNFERSISKIIKLYADNGYPYVNIKIYDYALDTIEKSPKLTLKIRIYEDTLMKVDEIRIFGNVNTKDNVIIRECGIRIGENYNESRIKRIKSRLLKLDIFQKVEEPYLSIYNNKGVLNIDVKENQSNSFDGIIGYQPGTNTGANGYFNGMVNISLGNLFGTGRKFKIYWNKESRSNQQTEIGYLEPWVMGLPIDLKLNYLQRDQDSIFVRRNIDAIGDISFFEDFSLAFSLNYQSIIPGSENQINASTFKSSALLFGFEFSIDTRDNKTFSRNGLLYSNKLELGNKTYLSDKSSKFLKIFHLNFESYLTIFMNQILYLTLKGKLIDTKLPEYSDLFPIGGFKSIRGYRENIFFGTQLMWSNIEYRFQTGGNSFIFPFLDIGYYNRPQTIDGFSNVKDYLYGYGIGITLETQFGVMKVNYAIGRGDSFSNGKIQFGYVNQF